MSSSIETLYEIQENNKPQLAQMFYANKYFNIDLASRTIESPEYLSVLKDHQAENVYFRINRFCDYMDLSTTTCVVQYKVRDEKGKIVTGIYPVPYYDIITEQGDPETGAEDKLIFPWCIDGRASQNAGPIEYAIRFYKIDRDGTKFTYNLNTLPATSKIMYGLDVKDNDLNGQYTLPDEVAYDFLLAEIVKAQGRDTFWIEYND